MQGAVRKYRIEGGKLITVIQRIQEELVPLVRRIPGFQGFYALNAEDLLVTIVLATDPRRIQEADEATDNWMRTLGTAVVLVSQQIITGSVVVEASSD
jgi:hypothetical protein